MLADLDKSLIDGFQATAVILAFAAVLFAVRYPEIVRDRDRPTVDRGMEEARKKYEAELRATLFVRVLPNLALFGVFAILLAPASIQIVSSFDFNPMHYNYIRAAWLATNILLFAFAIWTIQLASVLVKKLRN